MSSKLTSAEDREYVEWAKMFLDHSLGKTSVQEFNEKVKNWWDHLPFKNESGRLKVELSIARNEIEMLGPANMIGFFDLANRYYLLNDQIRTAQLDGSARIQYYLENVTNHGLLATKFDSIFRVVIGNQKMEGNVDNNLVQEYFSLRQRLVSDVDHVFPWIKPIARNFVHKVMLAKCLESQVSFHLHMDVNAIKYPITEFDFYSESYRQKVKLHVDFGLEAFQIFWEHQIYKNALNTLLIVLELNELAKYINVELDLDVVALMEKADWLVNRLEVEPKKLCVPGFLELYNKRVYVAKL
ncbi:hypothetical protein MKQ70_32720 [Chitinophaga sedimenti]|uniref:hypothetical protein n=1 Tax=Chitinophaga sedimenti TaxID=2033606 RepID=UPI002002D183|nr:hypothetical protein [Chitinophaga sedimenti]MCK7559480.1 hypothetical protein [Chitinophaga sedimenti]